MNVDHADVTMHVVDGIVMGPTHCAFNNCESELLNARGGSFCAIHERAYGSKCRMISCHNDKVYSTQVLGDIYVVCVSFTYLVLYRITLPILPRYTGYLRVDLISSCSTTFYDVLLDRYYVDCYHRHG